MKYKFLFITDDNQAIPLEVEEWEGGGWKSGDQILSEAYLKLLETKTNTLGNIKLIKIDLVGSNQ